MGVTARGARGRNPNYETGHGKPSGGSWVRGQGRLHELQWRW